MHEPSKDLPPSETAPSRPPAWQLAALWAGVFTALWVLGFLNDMQHPDNGQGGAAGSLLYSREAVFARVMMAIVGFVLVLLLFACLRYTRLRADRAPDA